MVRPQLQDFVETARSTLEILSREVVNSKCKVDFGIGLIFLQSL
jgi:uncharacterized Rmd1/YagE family protein